LSKRLDVGRSWRTWAKHDLMNSVIGQEVGAAGKLPNIDRLVWVDLTAGDAALVEGAPWRRACSPGILANHAAHSRKPVDIVLHEIQAATFDRLLGNLDQFLPELGYEKRDDNLWRLGPTSITALNVSGHEADATFMRGRDAVVVLNDPNAITEWAMRPTFAQEICDRTWCFRSLSTMGCNPAGIKRLPLEERLAWFEMVGTQQATLPHYRDLLLAAIERDSAQWAYLLCTASKWRSSSESVMRTAFGRAGRTTAMTWFGVDPNEFEETKRQLFLTKKELEEGVA
jgi:hypothetical protein